MSKCLVKSTKWSEHNGYTTWWGPNRSGYTSSIRQAGIYTDEEAKGLESAHGPHICVAVKFDEELFNQGLEQINREIEIQQEKRERYQEYIAICERTIADKKDLLEKYIDTMAIK